MDARELRATLERLGVELAADGERLRYRPQCAVTPVLRAAMTQRRDELLALLVAEEAEVRWRVDAMRTQMPWTGAIPSLSVHPMTRIWAGGCSSCGDALGPGERYRCTPCIRAAWQVLREVRAGPDRRRTDEFDGGRT